jgi:outer membrane protein TolC
MKSEMDIANEIAAKAEMRFALGQESYLTVIKAQMELQNLHRKEILLKQDILINRGRLLRALGAKWSKNCETP